MDFHLDTFHAAGFAIIPELIDAGRIEPILAELALLDGVDTVRRRGQTFAMRNVLERVATIAELAASPEVRSLVERILGAGCFAVRGILFDKIAAANWHVAWHQDLTIAVRRRLDVPGFGPWSLKAGVPHVQPPLAVLERMVTVRIHLDECTELNGPLRVIRGSHRLGRLDAAGIERCVAHGECLECLVPRGGAVVMRPLVVHSSLPATSVSHRRVVHLEFACDPLPAGLEWHARTATAD